MSALPQPEPEFAEVVEQDGEQVVHLPRSVHLMARQFRVEQTGDSLRLEPVRPRRTREQIEAWLRSMHELDAGEVIPGGRNQGVVEPEDIYPPDYFDGPEE
jgi:virulence-associated protein VagC